MSISKRTRFKVFDRDGYRCLYCGKSADDGVLLEVDHIIARANGGSDEMENLATACIDCNRGKSAMPIGSMPDESDQKRWRRLQELRELERASEEVTQIRIARERLVQDWVNLICDMAGTETCSEKLAVSAAKLSHEFDADTVAQWCEIVVDKIGICPATPAIKYLHGIARQVRLKNETSI